MSKYYCLIAGLPDIHPDDRKLPYTVMQFREEVGEQLSKKDKQLFDLYFLKFDNANLLRQLGLAKGDFDPRGLFSEEELAQLVKAVADEEQIDKRVPRYMADFVASVSDDKRSPELDAVLPADRLAAAYYGHALASSNAFAAAWFEFNLNVSNILTACSARKYRFDAANFIVGDTEAAKALRTSSARDWGLSATVDYLDAVVRIAEETDLYEREHKLDLLRWGWLDTNAFFHYFTAERLLAYVLKLEIIERWAELNKEAGEAQLREIIARLKSEVKLPADYDAAV